MEFSIIRNIIKTPKSNLDSFDLNEYKPFSKTWGVPINDFFELSGNKVYRLLINTSFVFNQKKFVIVGKKQSTTAMALALNDSNNVICFNKFDDASKFIKQRNIQFISDNVFDPRFKSSILESTIVFTEIETLGDDYKNLYNYLNEIGYKGLLFINNIHLNNDADVFWNSIHKEKYDLTVLGDSQGTGMVNFV